MKNLKLLTILFLINIPLWAQSRYTNFEIDSTYDGKKFVKGELLIKLKPHLKSSAKYQRLQENILKAQHKFNLSTKKEWRTQVQHWKAVDSKQDIDLDSIHAIIGKDNIEYIEPNYIIEAAAVKTSNLPSDPVFSEQWGLHNTGYKGSSPDVDVNAPEAWEITRGNNEIVVGIFDTGIDYSHEDLKSTIWVNPGEIPGNGIDDDGNGYIDDVHGYDFINYDDDPMDENGHGTHVAGIIGADDNGVGIVGVSPDVKLLALRILNEKGFGSTSAAIDAFEYAIKNNIKITNHSWGGSHSEALQDIINQAQLNDMILIVSSGNDAVDLDYSTSSFPASYENENIITVGAHDYYDGICSFSNTGISAVDIFAPGFEITSTYPNHQYKALSGTSMAAPFVTGAFALLRSQYPDKSNADLKNQILGSAEPQHGYEHFCISGGRLNLFNMLQRWTPVNLEISSNKLSFHGVKVNEESEELINTLKNAGNEIVIVDSIFVASPFLFRGTDKNKLTNIEINPGESYALSVRFFPESEELFRKFVYICYKSGGRQIKQKFMVDGMGCASGTIVKDTVSGTWTKAMSPIIVNSDLYIAPNKGLEIQPGVEVIFTGHFKISCDYQSWIKAIGTETDSIFFYPLDSIAGWNGIKLHEGHNGNVDFIAQHSNQFSYCRFSYGKNHVKWYGAASDDQINGGAIMSFWANIEIKNCYFYKNSTLADGGACSIRGTTDFTLESCTFNGNSASWAGACSFSPHGEVHVNNCIFKNNTAGAGILKFDYLNYITVSNSTFHYNGTNQGAAIIFNGNLGHSTSTTSETIVITNSLFAHNHNCAESAPVELFSVDTVVVVNNTFAVNWGNRGGGVFFTECPNVFFTNNILWENENFQYELRGNNSHFISSFNNIQDLMEEGTNISTNPQFTDYNHFKLSEQSPSLDKGIHHSLFNDTDNSRNDQGYTGGIGLVIDFFDLDFGQNGLNSAAGKRYFTIYNNSENTCSFNFDNTNPQFSTLSSCDVAPYSRKRIEVEFAPNTIGEVEDSIQIVSEDGKKATVQLNGEGIAGNSLSGSISGILRCSDSPFIVTNDIVVEQHDSLIIESCVDLYFTEGTKFIVKGVLIAKGNEHTNDTIRFSATSPDKSWGGLKIEGTADFEYCKFQQLEEIVVATQTTGFPEKFFSVSNSFFTRIKTSKNVLFFTNNYETKLTVDACKFYNNEVHSIIIAEAANNLLIRNSLIFNNSGIALYGYYNSDVQVVNSIFYNNSVLDKYKIPCIYLDARCTFNFVNSIIWNPEAPNIFSKNLYWQEFEKNSLHVKNCITFYPVDSINNDVGTEVEWTNNIIEDPLLVENGNNHFLLSDASPAIDAGENIYVDFSYDMDKKIRIWDGNEDDNAVVDIGCFEFGSVACMEMNLTEDVVICEGESYKGWNLAGQYSENLVSANGCDSIVITNLTVAELPVPEFGCSNDTLLCNEIFSSYQWYDQNGKIEGATSAQFIIEKSGTYYLRVTNSSGCLSISEGMNIIKTNTKERDEIPFDAVVMPNPAEVYFNVKVNSSSPGEYLVQLINKNGQVLQMKEFYSSLKVHEIEFKVNDLPQGIYFIRVNNATQSKIITVVLL